MRGIYAAGVLDVFHERGFHPFALAVGASAGACNLASHLAGQHDRNRRCYTTQMIRREFIDARRYLRGGHWMDLDYLWAAFDREDPLDVVAACASSTQLLVAATDVESGEPHYLEPTAATLNDVLLASSAMPVLYRRQIEFAGRRYVDGGISAPIPVEEAWRRGATRIMVLRSRPYVFEGPAWSESLIAAAVLRGALARTFLRYRRVYLQSVAFLRDPPAGVRVVEVAPQTHLRTNRSTRDPAALAADYALGRAAAEDAMRRWASPTR